jgi:DNA-binding transcriptional LysR family regulator
MSIDVRALRCFLAVCAAQSMTRAAQAMHLAQPAMSMQIKNLEAELGVQLFERSKRGTQLTPAGRRFEQRAQDLLNALQHAVDDVRGLDTRPTGPVTLGLPQSMSRLLTVPLVAETLRRWPEVHLQVAELSSGFVSQLLARGDIDIGITFERHDNPAMSYEHIAEEQLVLVGPAGALPAPRGEKHGEISAVPLAALQAYPLVMPGREHGLRILIDRIAQAHHIRLQPVAEVNAIHQILDVASSGVAYGVLSFAAVIGALQAGRVSAARIDSPPLSRPIYLAGLLHDAPSVAVSALRNLIKQTTRELIASGDWPAAQADD